MYYHPATKLYATEGHAFQLEGQDYPADWNVKLTSEDMAALGFLAVGTVGSYADPEFYINSEELVDGQLVITNVPRDPAQLAATMAVAREELLERARRLVKDAFESLMDIAGKAYRQGNDARWKAADSAGEALLVLLKDLPDDLPGTVATVTLRYQTLIYKAAEADPALLETFKDFQL